MGWRIRWLVSCLVSGVAMWLVSSTIVGYGGAWWGALFLEVTGFVIEAPSTSTDTIDGSPLPTWRRMPSTQ